MSQKNLQKKEKTPGNTKGVFFASSAISVLHSEEGVICSENLMICQQRPPRAAKNRCFNLVPVAHLDEKIAPPTRDGGGRRTCQN